MFLQLDETSTVDLDARPAATPRELEAVEVTASALGHVFTPDKMGAGTNVTREQIEALPSINRKIQDYVRLDPRVVQTDKERGEHLRGGQNPRYNKIRIDGVRPTTTFGLEANGLPTLSQPISIDRIEEINIDIVELRRDPDGDSSARNINAVTKSGTNEFHGAVYGIVPRQRHGRRGRERQRVHRLRRRVDRRRHVGGPIIKDKLFFFVGYEKFERSLAGRRTSASTGAAASTTVGDLAGRRSTRSIAIAPGYGIDPARSAGAADRQHRREVRREARLEHQRRPPRGFRYNKTESSVLRAARLRRTQRLS